MKQTLKEKIQELSKVKKAIIEGYSRLNELEKEIVSEIIETKQQETYKSIDISEEEHMDLVWAYEKRIDYEKLKREHPKIYELGLQTSWSKTQALNAIDSKELLETILKDYTTINGEYKVKLSRKKKNYKRKPLEIVKRKVEVDL